MSAVGGPLRTTGEREPTSVSITVRDDTGAVVRFDDENRADPDGAYDRLPLPTEPPVLHVALPTDAEYHFDAGAVDTAGNLLAYGDAGRYIEPQGSAAIALDLDSLLGTARLTSRTPIHSLLPGQELDLLLAVTPRTRPDLVVPPSDYAASYEVVNGEALEISDWGARVRAGDPADGDLVVNVTATGRVLNAGSVEPGSVKATLTIPFSTFLTVDLDPPTLSGLEFDGTEKVLRGVANDTVGVAMLEVYDGPVLLATTDLDAAAHKGVPEVVFPGGGTRFQAPVHLSSGDYSLTIIATDFSDNETQQELVIAVP